MCPVSFRLISSVPASSGSSAAVWFPLSTPSTTAPMPSLHLRPPGRAARGDHRCEPPQGMHGCGRHAWQPQTQRQTARPRRSGHAGRCLPRQYSCFQAGLVLRPAGFFTITAGAAENPLGNCSSPAPRGGFCMPQAGSSFTASTTVVSKALAETANEDRPLTSSVLLPRPVLWGSLVEAAYAPG
jgi:hypothetical protein